MSVIPQTPTIESSEAGDVTDGSSFTLTCSVLNNPPDPSYIFIVDSVQQAPQTQATLQVGILPNFIVLIDNHGTIKLKKS